MEYLYILNIVLEQFPQLTIFSVLLYVLWRIHTKVDNLYNLYEATDKQVIYIKTKLDTIKKDLDNLKIKTTEIQVKSENLKERMDRANINGVINH